jgi:branched-chain amino acid transport system permease protein
MGIDNRKLYALAFAIAMIFTALAGVFFGIRTIFAPSSGPIRLILAFEAVIIGGLGSMWGTLIGGVVLGLAQAVGAAIDPTWQTLAGHLAFLAILIVRPSGLFPRTRD